MYIPNYVYTQKLTLSMKFYSLGVKKIRNPETLPRHKLWGWPGIQDHVRWEYLNRSSFEIIHMGGNHNAYIA